MKFQLLQFIRAYLPKLEFCNVFWILGHYYPTFSALRQNIFLHLGLGRTKEYLARKRIEKGLAAVHVFY